MSRRREDGAGAPEPAVSALGRGRRRPFAALRLQGARRWRRLWAQEAEAGPGREGKGREGKEGKRAGRGSGPGATGRGLQPGRSAKSSASGLARRWATSPGTETQGGFGRRRGRGK